MINERKLTKAELAKREEIMMDLKKNKRSLVKRYGKDAEKVMYGRATNIAKKQAESMDQDRIREAVKAALKNPKKADLNQDGKPSDYEKKRGTATKKSVEKQDLKEFGSSDMSAALNSIHRALDNPEEFPGIDKILNAAEDAVDFYMDDFEEYHTDYDGLVSDVARRYANRYHSDFMDNARRFMEPVSEDLDLGHQDNEPHMLKADLYRIGKYAMELYQMLDGFEGKGEVDLPSWWQAKIINSKDAIVSAKHYLDFEMKEPQIDAMVDVAAEEDVIDENSFFQKRLAKLAADEKEKREKNPGYAAASKADFGDLLNKGQSYQEFKKRLDKLEEGVWSLGDAKQISQAIQSLEMLFKMDAASIADSLENDNGYYYKVLGDDLVHDALDRAEKAAAMGNEDGAYNGLSDAIGRAEELLAHRREQESARPYKTDRMFEEEAGETDKVASDIQKAMNKHKGDDAKMHQLQKARTAMNKGDLEKAKKIAARLAEKLKSK